MKRVIWLSVMTAVIMIIAACSGQVPGAQTEVGTMEAAEAKSPAETVSYGSGLDSFETDSLICEEKYLASINDEDLKTLCSQLSILPWNKKQLREMVLNYYPVFFEKLSEEQIEDISSNGFDPFYIEYVFAYKAEGKGGLIAIYKEYKEKANNKYYYAMIVYDYVLRLDNLSDDEYAFLYDEAYNLYAEARGNAEKVNRTENEIREAFINVLGAKGCVNDISEALGKEIEPDILKDFQDYAQDCIKLLNSYDK